MYINENNQIVLDSVKVVISATNIVSNKPLVIIFYALTSSNGEEYEIIPIVSRKSPIKNIDIFLDAVVGGNVYTVDIQYPTYTKILKNVKISQRYIDKVFKYDSLVIQFKNDDVTTCHTLDWEI